MIRRQVLEEFFWTDAGPAGKDALKMEFAHADVTGHQPKAGLAGHIVRKERDGLLNPDGVKVGSAHAPVIRQGTPPRPPDSCCFQDSACSGMSIRPARQRLIDTARIAGELYGLVPLVGHPARVPVEQATEKDLLDSMRVNFVGPVLLARDFAAAVGAADAAVVFVSTMQGIGIFPGSTTYAAPKAAAIQGK